MTRPLPRRPSAKSWPLSKDVRSWPPSACGLTLGSNGVQQRSASAVEQGGHQAHGAAEFAQQGTHLARASAPRAGDAGSWPPPPSAATAAPTAARAVKEHQGRAGLILRGGCHRAIHGQVGEEGRHLRRAQLARVAPPMEADEAPGPVDVSLFGADRIVAHPDGVAQRVQQARRGRGRGTLISCRGLFGIHRQSNLGGIDNRGR